MVVTKICGTAQKESKHRYRNHFRQTRAAQKSLYRTYSCNVNKETLGCLTMHLPNEIM